MTTTSRCRASCCVGNSAACHADDCATATTTTLHLRLCHYDAVVADAAHVAAEAAVACRASANQTAAADIQGNRAAAAAADAEDLVVADYCDDDAAAAAADHERTDVAVHVQNRAAVYQMAAKA
jgi:hypothetical protein